MGQIAIVHDAVRGCLTDHDWSGRYIDFLEREFPDGFGGRPCVTYVDGRRVETEDFEFEVGDREVMLAFAPEGFELGALALALAAVSVVVSVAAILLAPKPPGLDGEDSASSVYGVGAQANKARLGAPIPVCYGEVLRTPEYASESYRMYMDNSEIRYFLLCVGGGSYEIDDVRLGETSVDELTPGLVEWQVYRPDDHQGELGVIGADFGLHENVVTSVEIDSQELVDKTKFLDRADASVSGSVLTVDSDIASLAEADDLLVLGDSPADGTYTIASATGSTITIDGTFPANFSTRTIDLAIVGGPSRIIGPVVCNPVGTTTQKIELDFSFPAGLNRRDNSGRLREWSVTIEIILTPIDDDGIVIGSTITRNVTYSAATATPQNRSYEIAVPPGRYTMQVQRIDQQTPENETDRTQITGLKAYLDFAPNTPAYGDTTIVAVKITGAEEISRSAQTQIKVKSRSILPRLDNGVLEATNNPADVFADIVRNSTYGGGDADGIETETLLAWRAEQASRSGFNGIFDSATTVWEALTTVGLIGRAQPVPRGSKMGLVIDGPRNNRTSIVQPDSIIKGSAKMQFNWPKPGDNDGIEVEYRTAADFTEAFTRFPEDADDPKRTLIVGLTDDDEADSLAEYLWRQQIMRNVTFDFETELLGLTFDLYDRVGFAFPHFDMNDGAQVLAESGRVLTLSKPLTQGNVFMLLRDTEGRSSDVLTGVSEGTTITLDADPPFATVIPSNGMPVVCLVAPTEADIEDITIKSIAPSGRTVRVEAVNYVPNLWEGLI